MSPGCIICGRTYDYTILCGKGTQYGKYVQTHEKTNNTMQMRTVGAINIQPSGEKQGTFYYFSLESGYRLHQRRCTPLPITTAVIEIMHHMATP